MMFGNTDTNRQKIDLDGKKVLFIGNSQLYHCLTVLFKDSKTVSQAERENDRGIIHRDVKPENVIVELSGRVVLIDLNASRIESNASKDTVIMGTVGYASPEQMGINQSDSRTDIYAVGVLLNVMLTGKHPSDVLVKGRPGRIVQKCTQINPDLRYQDALRLAKAL